MAFLSVITVDHILVAQQVSIGSILVGQQGSTGSILVGLGSIGYMFVGQLQPQVTSFMGQGSIGGKHMGQGNIGSIFVGQQGLLVASLWASIDL